MNIQGIFESLQADLNQLDKERRAARLSLFMINFIWLLLSLAILVAAFYWSYTTGIAVLFFIILFWEIPLYFLWRLRRRGIKEVFRKSFKEQLITKIVAKVDPSFTYQPYKMTYRNENLLFLPVISLFRKGYAKLFNAPLINKAIKKIDPTFIYYPDNTHYPKERSEPITNHLKRTRLFSGLEACWVEDMIVGNIGKNKFEFSEITIGAEGRGHQYISYQGVLLIVHLTNSLPSPIFILPNSFDRKLDKVWEFMNPSVIRGKPVELNHENFNEFFKVFAEDPTFAHALLQKSVLENLTIIHRKVATINPLRNSIQFAFVDNTITIAVRLKTNLFEPRLSRSINKLEFIESNINYLVLFLSLIEDLDLNRGIEQ